MKKIVLLVVIAFTGLFLEDRLQKNANQQNAQAIVVDIEKIKNSRKGGKPFVYEVNIVYESPFGRSYESSFISQRRPLFQQGSKIDIVYSPTNPSKVSYKNKKPKYHP